MIRIELDTLQLFFGFEELHLVDFAIEVQVILHLEDFSGGRNMMPLIDFSVEV